MTPFEYIVSSALAAAGVLGVLYFENHLLRAASVGLAMIMTAFAAEHGMKML